jgi:hypothetical protein
MMKTGEGGSPTIGGLGGELEGPKKLGTKALAWSGHPANLGWV